MSEWKKSDIEFQLCNLVGRKKKGKKNDKRIHNSYVKAIRHNEKFLLLPSAFYRVFLDNKQKSIFFFFHTYFFVSLSIFRTNKIK